ncbi:hypothetical protein SAMN05660710_00808 [Paracoccus tibetensis]|uniref:Uncharacterized protein n=1 Tax=Paracoccus tibetensis TaxID=336292 RepID=A0A1G5DH53_9RHOB|nr:hypothetical protein SAMN05660710_00808 [Paracoccus tibetensis]
MCRCTATRMLAQFALAVLNTVHPGPKSQSTTYVASPSYDFKGW